MRNRYNFLIKKFPNVKFSDEFFESNNNDLILYKSVLYLEKLETFIDYYDKYNPIGIRIIKGVDLYEESKIVYDKIVNSEICIDEVFMNPDNPLRNIVMLLHIDEPSLIKRNNLI